MLDIFGDGRGKKCCQDANRGIEDLQIRLGISAQALMVEAHSCSTNKNYEILMSSKSRPAPPKRIQQTSEPLDLRETSQETQSRESAGQPIFSSFTSFP